MYSHKLNMTDDGFSGPSTKILLSSTKSMAIGAEILIVQILKLLSWMKKIFWFL